MKVVIEHADGILRHDNASGIRITLGDATYLLVVCDGQIRLRGVLGTTLIIEPQDNGLLIGVPNVDRK